MKRDLNVDAFYGALESKKSELGVSWRGLAAELELSDHTVFTRMSRGQTPDVDTLLSLSGWLGVPLEDLRPWRGRCARQSLAYARVDPQRPARG